MLIFSYFNRYGAFCAPLYKMETGTTHSTNPLTDVRQDRWPMFYKTVGRKKVT
jgi:hypothetical protein